MRYAISLIGKTGDTLDDSQINAFFLLYSLLWLSFGLHIPFLILELCYRYVPCHLLEYNLVELHELSDKAFYYLQHNKMDALTIVAVISGITGLGVAVLSHLRHSECCSGCCKFDTRTPTNTPAPSPVLIHKQPETVA